MREQVHVPVLEVTMQVEHQDLASLMTKCSTRLLVSYLLGAFRLVQMAGSHVCLCMCAGHWSTCANEYAERITGRLRDEIRQEVLREEQELAKQRGEEESDRMSKLEGELVTVTNNSPVTVTNNSHVTVTNNSQATACQNRKVSW